LYLHGHPPLFSCISNLNRVSAPDYDYKRTISGFQEYQKTGSETNIVEYEEPMKSICVFCGSSPGKEPLYVETAVKLGKTLAQRDIRLVYGGASVGTMGATAVSVLKNGGSVTGVITKQLVNMEVANTDLTDLRIVDTMHDRKAMMAELSDGFIALPGGFGTIEELFEAITWAQLGIQKKPCGILNVGGYYDKLLEFIDHMIDHGFVKSDYRELIKVDDTPGGLIEQFNDYTPVTVDKAKWVLSATSPVFQ